MSPSSAFNYSSHSTAHSSPSPHGAAVHSGPISNQQLLATPCQSSPHVNMGSPPSQARPGQQVNITAQNNISPSWTSTNQSNIYTSPITNTPCTNPQNGGFYNSLVQENRFGTNLNEDKDPLSMSPGNLQDQQRVMLQTQEKPFEQGMCIINLILNYFFVYFNNLVYYKVLNLKRCKTVQNFVMYIEHLFVT